MRWPWTRRLRFGMSRTAPPGNSVSMAPGPTAGGDRACAELPRREYRRMFGLPPAKEIPVAPTRLQAA